MTSTLQIKRKPCIALMGEFSSGKSTLANLLIGQNPLPVQIVATRLPPIRISHGDDRPFRVDLDGDTHPIDLRDLAGVDLESTLFVQIFSTEEMLERCDLMDMPGISDPNISSEVWERMIDQADGVLWCSHATQAWRQSEAAVWAQLPEALYQRSLLLLTRADKLRSPADRDRVLKRVQKETDGMFRACLPISLLIATEEQNDYMRWSESGAEQFAAHLVSLIEDLNGALNGTSSQGGGQDRALRLPGLSGPDHPDQVPPIHRHSAPAAAAPKVIPRRIQRPSTSGQA